MSISYHGVTITLTKDGLHYRIGAMSRGPFRHYAEAERDIDEHMARSLRVKIYDVTGPARKEFRAECDIGECFPGDEESAIAAARDIVRHGQCWLGGGAAPAVILEAA